MMRLGLFLLLLCQLSASGQSRLENRNYFKKFFRTNSTSNLLIIGENHASSASSGFYPSLVKYLHKKAGLSTLLIEFGPSEAFFYTRYLQTGEEKHLNYTLYAGAIKGWREAWRELYAYNKTLKTPLKVKGMDFDRARTLAYAIISVFMVYDSVPPYMQPLLAEIRTDKFYNTYTIGYPNEKDIAWMTKAKRLMEKHLRDLKGFLKEEHLIFIQDVLANKAVKYAEGREEALAANTRRLIEESTDKNFLLLIGRNHGYLHPVFGEQKRLAKMLADSSSINLCTGVTLFENSSLGTSKNKDVTLFEISQKAPWKRYRAGFEKLARKKLTVVPLRGELCPLAHHTDFVVVARDQKPYEKLHPDKP